MRGYIKVRDMGMSDPALLKIGPINKTKDQALTI